MPERIKRKQKHNRTPDIYSKRTRKGGERQKSSSDYNREKKKVKKRTFSAILRCFVFSLFFFFLLPFFFFFAIEHLVFPCCRQIQFIRLRKTEKQHARQAYREEPKRTPLFSFFFFVCVSLHIYVSTLSVILNL